MDRRGQVLAMFDEADTLAGFQTHENHLRIRTVDQAVVTVDLDQIETYEFFTRRKPFVVQSVGEVLGAETVELSVSLQFVLGWEGVADFDEATRSAVARVMPGVAEHGVTDCALLIDGSTAGWDYQAEFGVLAAADLPDRLARRIGRRLDQGTFDPRQGPPADVFPAVSTFVDCTWFRPGQRVELSTVDNLVDDVTESACKLAAGLHTEMCG